MAGAVMGRPSLYSPEIAATICERISSGEILTNICKEPGMPNIVTVLGNWLDAHPDFAKLYARAKMRRLEVMAEEITAISDDSTGDWIEDAEGNRRANPESVQRSRLRVDTRKWLLAKLAAKTYGDKRELSGDAANPLTLAVEYVHRAQVGRAPDGIIDARPARALDAPKSEE